MMECHDCSENTAALSSTVALTLLILFTSRNVPQPFMVCTWSNFWNDEPELAVAHLHLPQRVLPSICLLHHNTIAVLLSTHTDRQGMDISFTFLFFFVFVRLWISLPRIKLAASNFAHRFIGVQSRESHIFVNFAPQKPKNGTARWPRPPACNHCRRDAPFVKSRGGRT